MEWGTPDLSIVAKQAERELLKARELQAVDPWRAYIIECQTFPCEARKRELLRTMLLKLTDTFLRDFGLHRAVWLSLDHLHKDNQIQEVSRNGRLWNPTVGIGLPPEEPPPRYWTSKDLLDRDYDSPMPVLKHTVLHLDTDVNGGDLAIQVMAGSGGLLLTFHLEHGNTVRDCWYRTFQPLIEEEGLAAYPLYVPLLSANSLNSDGQSLDLWMGRVDIYVRESVEDGGILILSRRSIGDSIRACDKLLFEETITRSST